MGNPFETIENRLNLIETLLLDIKHNQNTLPGSQDTPAFEQPINVQGAANFTGFDEQTIYRLARCKEVPCHKRGNRLYFYKSELNNWIKDGNSQINKEAEESFLRANSHKKKR
jgi:excisionase family DNA binding protein